MKCVEDGKGGLGLDGVRLRWVRMWNGVEVGCGLFGLVGVGRDWKGVADVWWGGVWVGVDKVWVE